MRRAERPLAAVAGRVGVAAALLAGPVATAQPVVPAQPAATAQPVAAACTRPVYLSFDTGHMGVAPLVADVLQREQVVATFFLAQERTLDGGGSLDERWAPWWRSLAAQGHAFGSHTWDHHRWLADRPDGRFELRASMGPAAGQRQVLDAAGYCAELRRPADRFKAMTGRDMLPIFRAPGGKTSPALLRAAQACGWQHVGWTPAGFLGDELPSDRHPNAQLLRQALERVRPGDILLAHLGIWSRQDPWAPAVLQPLLAGLKARGLCFATLDRHPAYAGGGSLQDLALARAGQDARAR